MEALLKQSRLESKKIGVLLLHQDPGSSFELLRRVVEGSLYKVQSGHFLAWL